MPYVCWFAVIWVTFAVVGLASGDLDLVALVKPFAGSVHAARPFTTFWFISALFFVAVLYRFLDRVGMIVKLGLAAALFSLGWAAGPLLSKLPLSLGSAIICIAFVIVGQFLRRYAARADRRTAAIAGGLVIAVVAVSPFIAPIDIKYGEYGTLFISVIVSLAMCWAAVIIATFAFASAPALAERFQPPAARLATVVTCVVLTHPFVLYLLGATRIDTQWWHYVLAVVLPWVLGLFLLRTPARRFLVGS